MTVFEVVLTFFYPFHRSDEVINKVLHITQGIGDACRFVYLGQGRVEYRDNILEQICRKALERKKSLRPQGPNKRRQSIYLKD